MSRNQWVAFAGRRQQDMARGVGGGGSGAQPILSSQARQSRVACKPYADEVGFRAVFQHSRAPEEGKGKRHPHPHPQRRITNWTFEELTVWRTCTLSHWLPVFTPLRKRCCSCFQMGGCYFCVTRDGYILVCFCFVSLPRSLQMRFFFLLF